MNRIARPLALVLSLSLLGCQPAPPPAGDAANAEASSPAAPAAPAAPPAPAPSPGSADETGGSFAGGLSADAIAAASQDAPAYGAGDAPNLDALKAAVDRVQQANARLRDAEAGKASTAGAPPSPAAPAAPRGVPPVQLRLTGDSIVPKAPELANDVVRGIQNVFAAQTGCTAIAGIDTRAVSAQGPFNKNAQGRLVSGTIVERWTVNGCGKSAAYHLVLSVRPDSTVDYAITAA